MTDTRADAHDHSIAKVFSEAGRERPSARHHRFARQAIRGRGMRISPLRAFRSLGEFQLPHLGRRGAGFQHRHLDPTHGPGLAGAHPADASQRHRRRRGDRPAVRPAAVVAAVHRLCGGPIRPAQAADRHPDRHERALPGLGAFSPSPVRYGCGRSMSSRSCRAAWPRSMRPASQTFVGDLVGDGDLSNAVALNSTSFQRRADDRSGDRGAS